MALFWDAVQKSSKFLQNSSMHKCANPLPSVPHCCVWLFSHYNALYHLISEHSSGSIPPPIPGQLLVQIFINKGEEKALGISEHITVDRRRQNNIPDSDGVELGQTRKRSDTVSRVHSDSHDQKKEQIGRNTKVDIITSLCEISLYFYNLNTSGSCGSCCSEVFARQHSHFPMTVGDAWFHRELRCMSISFLMLSELLESLKAFVVPNGSRSFF
jgi:hypothetical protein